MRLSSLLALDADNVRQIVGSTADLAVAGLTIDSRTVSEGDIFFALAGTKQHGLSHAGQALERGACAIVYEPEAGGEQLARQFTGIPVIAVAKLRDCLGQIAARFYGDPSSKMQVIGITGTNGKTSCSQFLSQTLPGCGVIGTLGWGTWGNLAKTANTTPDALSVQQMLAGLAKTNTSVVAMEVSSHGLEQGRVNGVNFTGAVYTNISRDHLDYHGTMAAYFQAKLLLLRQQGLKFVVVNLDDPYSDEIIAAIPDAVNVWGVSIKGKRLLKGESVVAENLAHQHDGTRFLIRWQQHEQVVTVPLYGDFNIENVLLVLAVMLAIGTEFAEAVNKLASLQPVPGRMERFGGGNQPLVVVDYAHTPDALDKVLASLRKHCTQDLWVVFGCGGNRDAGKRPLMGEVAERWADHVIVTDDNPRFETGQAIIEAILAGCKGTKVEAIADRRSAIQAAISRAAGRDCLVIAGKGHEDYQEIAGVQHPFSDRQVVIDALKMRA